MKLDRKMRCRAESLQQSHSRHQQDRGKTREKETTSDGVKGDGSVPKEQMLLKHSQVERGILRADCFPPFSCILRSAEMKLIQKQRRFKGMRTS